MEHWAIPGILTILIAAWAISNIDAPFAKYLSDFIAATVALIIGLLFIAFDIQLFISSGESLIPAKKGDGIIASNSSLIFHLFGALATAFFAGALIYYALKVYCVTYKKLQAKL